MIRWAKQASTAQDMHGETRPLADPGSRGGSNEPASKQASACAPSIVLQFWSTVAVLPLLYRSPPVTVWL